MKYKIGDKVLIKSLDWYNENKNQLGRVSCGSKSYTIEMCSFCGKTLTIQAIGLDFYLMEEDNLGYEFTDEMIEGLVEEDVDLIPKFGEFSDNEPLDIPTMTTDFIKEHGFPCPNGYIFKDENGNVINATKIVLEKKKKEYPKTYEECCVALEYIPHTDDIIGYKWDILQSLQKLLICRDAYWKLYGEEMGLGKPWEPDWNNPYTTKWTIVTGEKVRIVRGSTRSYHSTFAFPTEEIRDAFYENFKELIESCKELL